jgi:hypothetical protein
LPNIGFLCDKIASQSAPLAIAKPMSASRFAWAPSSVASGISSSTACPPKTYSTSNASIIPISTLASTLSVERADRFLGTYFVSPVSRMARVEVIRQIVRQRAKMGTQRRARKSKDAKRDPPRREPPREGEQTRGKRTSFSRGDRHRCFARSPIINSSH